MELGHLFEAVMLVCFGFSWPLNVIKAFKARTAKGTSLAFIILIITGYVAGITAKFINHQFNYVLAVYFLNLVIVMSNVVVYIRNKALDKKAERVATRRKISELQTKYKNNETFPKEDNMNYKELNNIAEKNAVILFGGALDKEIPVTELAESFSFNFKIYNRSDKNISVKNAADFFTNNIKSLEPEGIIIHLGDKDANFFRTNTSDFDGAYLNLLSTVKAANPMCRIAIVSVMNERKDKNINEMNRHIKAIADSEKCDFINLDNAKLWNPKASKASVDFAYNMGLHIRKPLINVAEILYSYACLEMEDTSMNESLVG